PREASFPCGRPPPAVLADGSGADSGARVCAVLTSGGGPDHVAYTADDHRALDRADSIACPAVAGIAYAAVADIDRSPRHRSGAQRGSEDHRDARGSRVVLR